MEAFGLAIFFIVLIVVLVGGDNKVKGEYGQMPGAEGCALDGCMWIMVLAMGLIAIAAVMAGVGFSV